MRKSLYIVICVLVVLLGISTPIYAQSNDTAWLSPPNVSNFPQIVTYLNVYDQQGNFVSGLGTGDVTIQEDENSIQPNKITEELVGAHVVFAINFGRTMAIQDSQGVSRWDILRAALEEWGENYPQEKSDDLSLLTNAAGESRHIDQIDRWLDALRRIDIDPRDSQPNMDVFANALDTAADPSSQAGRGRIVILITPPPNQTGSAAIQNLTSLAVQRNTRVVVWMVSSEDVFDSPSANQLRDLAAQTGGSFFAFSGVETIPNFDESIEPLRKTYRLEYNSQLQGGLEHTLSATVDTGEATVTTGDQLFNLEVLPPKAILVSPPQEINLRVEIVPDETPEANRLSYSPEEHSFDILIEFPDGLVRPIERTALYINDQLIDQNTDEPFDRFTWDLTEVQANNTFQVSVEVTDSLGNSNRSVQTPIRVTVDRTPRSVVAVAYQYRWWVIGSTTILAAGIILAILVSGGKLQPRIMPRRKSSRVKTIVPSERQKRKDPVTQPVNIQQAKPSSRLPAWVKRFTWSTRPPLKEVPAYIEPFQVDDLNNGLKSIELAAEEIIIGSDTTQSSVIIDNPGVEPVHTRIISEPEENYRIFDLSSVAGTLLNFAPLPPSGARLRHGDIIHIGAIPYRVMFRDPSRIPRPVVQPLERDY